MALPIKDTPVLKGRDAKRFQERFLEKDPKPISQEEFNKMKKDYEKIKSLPEKCGIIPHRAETPIL